VATNAFTAKCARRLQFISSLKEMESKHGSVTTYSTMSSVADVVLWWGNPIQLTKFVTRVAGNDYWMAVSLYRPDKAVLMYAFRSKPALVPPPARQ
jgi:hypothetical protein